MPYRTRLLGTSVSFSERAFFGIATLLFCASAALTIFWSARMATMSQMSMPGGWTMSMTWMRMPGQTWFGATTSFLGMWMIMMVAMMLPCLVAMLWRYRQAFFSTGETHPGALTALVAAGYFCVWLGIGMIVYPVGAGLAVIEMNHTTLGSAVPILVPAVVLVAGLLQFSGWKARRLACCRAEPRQVHVLSRNPGSAWRYGLHLGTRCSACCAGLTGAFLVVGMMDLRAMAAVTGAITAERLAPTGERVGRVTGAIIIATGLTLMAQQAAIR